MNPYAAPQTKLSAAEQDATTWQPNETRWYYMEYGYLLGLLAGGSFLLIQLPTFWLITGLVHAIVALPICTIGGLLLGAVAAMIDRLLQELGWRKPHRLLEIND